MSVTAFERSMRERGLHGFLCYDLGHFRLHLKTWEILTDRWAGVDSGPGAI